MTSDPTVPVSPKGRPQPQSDQRKIEFLEPVVIEVAGDKSGNSKSGSSNYSLVSPAVLGDCVTSTKRKMEPTQSRPRGSSASSASLSQTASAIDLTPASSTEQAARSPNVVAVFNNLQDRSPAHRVRSDSTSIWTLADHSSSQVNDWRVGGDGSDTPEVLVLHVGAHIDREPDREEGNDQAPGYASEGHSISLASEAYYIRTKV